MSANVSAKPFSRHVRTFSFDRRIYSRHVRNFRPNPLSRQRRLGSAIFLGSVVSASWLVGWLVGWSLGWLVYVGLLERWLPGWLVGRLVGWLVSWLVGWLVDQLAGLVTQLAGGSTSSRLNPQEPRHPDQNPQPSQHS